MVTVRPLRSRPPLRTSIFVCALAKLSANFTVLPLGLLMEKSKLPNPAPLEVIVLLAAPVKSTEGPPRLKPVFMVTAGFIARLPQISRLKDPFLVKVGANAAPVQSILRQ